jgi:hypothetical protein
VIAAIDFGASMTKAAVSNENDESVPVLIDHEPESSSAVFLERPDRLVSGVAALNSSRRRPHQMQAGLKRRINRADTIEPIHQEVEFDVIATLPLVRCVATVIGYAWAAIREHSRGESVSLLLTHPVGWTAPQRAALLEAARIAGVTPAGMVSEAEAVGWHVCGTGRYPGPLLVVDLGASTLDIAVLDIERAGHMRVVHSDGDNNIGGDDFDRAIIDLTFAALRADTRNPRLLGQFVELCDELPHIAAREAERVKRELGTDETAAFAHQAIVVDIDQEDFNKATSHLIDRIVSRVRRAIDHGGAPPKTMVVSGGAARLPQIAEQLADMATDSGMTLLHWGQDGLTGSPATAVALGATRIPQPWSGADATALCPVTLRDAVLPATSRHLVAVPDGVVVDDVSWSLNGTPVVVQLRTDRRTPQRLLKMPQGVAQLSYDSVANRLVTASGGNTICTWRLGRETAPRLAYAYWRGPRVWAGSTADSSVTAVAARDELAAWTESGGPGVIYAHGWRPYQPGFPVRWLGFTGTPHLLALGADRLVIVQPTTGSQLDTMPLSDDIVATSLDHGLVFVASDKELRCYTTAGGRFELSWQQSRYAVSAMNATVLKGCAVLVVYDGTGHVYRALDVVTGGQLALKDAIRAPEPVALLADGVTGVLYPRHADGTLSLLGFGPDRP